MRNERESVQKKMVAGIAITANKILRFQGANIRRAVRDAAAFRRVKEGIKKPSSFRRRLSA